MVPTRRASLMALAAAALLPGCVIAPYGAYYRPSTSHGSVTWRRAYCGGKAGPNTGVRLDMGNGLAVDVRSVLDPGSLTGLSIRLVFELPAGATMTLAEPLRLRNDANLASERFTDPSFGGRAPGPGDRWQAGEALSTGGSTGRVELQAFVAQPGERLSIVWPKTRFNGEPLAWPDLSLERRRFDGGIEPFNC